MVLPGIIRSKFDGLDAVLHRFHIWSIATLDMREADIAFSTCHLGLGGRLG